MKKWLMIALAWMLLTGYAFAEETPVDVIIYFQDGSMVLLPAEIVVTLAGI